jgi:hypothetical protein
MSNTGSASARASFEPHHGKDPTGWHVVLKPDHDAAMVGRRFESQPIGPLNATTKAATPT